MNSNISVSSVENVSVTTNNKDLTVESSNVQSRGTSPMAPASECEETSHEGSEEQMRLKIGQSRDVKAVVGPEQESVSIKTCEEKKAVECNKVESISSLEEGTKNESTETQVKEIKSTETDDKKEREIKRSFDDLPRTTVIDNVTIVEMSPIKKVAPMISESKTNSVSASEDIPDKTEVKCDTVKCANAQDNSSGCVSYNPFLDPQILQAADGLELLSALAEQRSKCVDNDTTYTKDCNDKENENKKLFAEPKSDPTENKKAQVKQKRKPSISRTRSIPPSKPSKNESGSYYTSTGLRIPQG